MENIHYQFTAVTHKLLQEHYVSGSSQQAIKADCPGVFSFYFNATEALISLQGIEAMLKQSYHVINFSNIPSLLR